MLATEELSDRDWNAVSEAMQSPDPWIRYAARCVAERQPRDQWQRFLSSTRQSPPAEAFMMLARTKDDTLSRSCLEKMNQVEWSTLDPGQERAVAYSYWLCLRTLKSAEGPAVQTLRQQTLGRLAKVYPRNDYQVDQWLSEILIGSDLPALTATLDRMNATTNQNQRMHFIYVLRNKRSEWTKPLRQDYFTALAETNEYLGGQGMPDFIDKIRQEVLATLNAEEKKLYAKVAVVQEADTIATTKREFVKKWTFEELSRSEQILKGAGNAERGRRLFAETSCNQCHRFQNRGRSVGPDLTFVTSRFGRVDLLRSIVHPSEVIAEKYRSLQIVTVDGNIINGRPAPGGDYRSPLLRLATDPLNLRKIVEINKEDIEIQQPSPNSWMPTGLMDTLTESEIIDLLTFLDG